MRDLSKIRESKPPTQICTRCIYNDRVSGIRFDEQGICNYCRQVESLKIQYGTGQAEGQKKLDAIIARIKKNGRHKAYDCVVGVSGGTDSSYLLMKAVEWGLRPLAVHYDNTWNSAVATANIQKITAFLGVDLFTYVVDNKEIDNIKKAFLLSGVPEFDTDTDIAFVQVIRRTAAKYGITYILEGHSFTAEGLTPVGVNYFDGRYVADIHDTYGSGKRVTFPNMDFLQFMKWVLIYRQKFIRPLWYIDYNKEKATEALIEKTGWQYYGGHHLENRSSTFAHTVWLPQRFGIDYRNLTLAASVRAGRMDRQAALNVYSSPIEDTASLITYLKKRLNLSDEEYEGIMAGPKRTFRDFKTYKQRFEQLRPLFYILAKANFVPMSFYLKYCFPIKPEK